MKKVCCFAWGIFLLLITTPVLFAEKTPSDLFLISNVHDSPFFSAALRSKENKAYLEKVKIQYLIDAVRKSSLVFIRNGEPHKGTKAAAHLSQKYAQAGRRVKTADDFIEGIASQSFLTGRAYLVRNSEGKTFPIRDVLYNELERLKQFLT